MADDDILRLLSEDDGDPRRLPDPEPPLVVDVTTRLPDGTVVRVAANASGIRFSVVGADGMATMQLSPGDASQLCDMLQWGERGARRAERGW